MSDERYRQALSTLATAEARRARAAAEAMAWYEGEVDKREQTLDAAVTAVDNASIRVAAGHSMVGRVEEEADRLWQDLRSFLGRLAGRRLGPVPPADPDAGPAGPWRHIQAARTLLDRARHPRPLRRVLYLLLPFLGAAGAAGLTLLVRLGWRLAGGLPGWLGTALAVLGAPIVAILLARWVTRREGARLDGGSVGGAVLGALVAVSFMMIFVR
jgi:hypothetical protein